MWSYLKHYIQEVIEPTYNKHIMYFLDIEELKCAWATFYSYKVIKVYEVFDQLFHHIGSLYILNHLGRLPLDIWFK